MASIAPEQHEQFYVVGGNLRPDAPSYVPRQADDDLYDALSRGEFCYILTSRQMGKSSLIVRTGMRLAQDGVHVVTLDLTGIGQNLTPEQWYSGLLLNIGDRLDLEDELDDFWEDHEQLSPVQRLVEALRRVVLRQVDGRVVLFLDEIDVAQSLPFSANEFFAAIRHCYTRRSEDAEFERLSFCLAGVATPSDLIDDPLTTPFNIGTRIDLSDFREDEAARLAEGLGREDVVAAMLVRRVLHWTNGHPYLTQRMCQAVQADASVRSSRDVDLLCEELLHSERARDQDPNLQFVRNQMLWRDLDHAALLGIYRDVVRGRRVANDETSPLIGVLRLAGIVIVDAGVLGTRNAVYDRAFDKQWIRENMPDAELRRQRTAALKATFRTAAVAATVLAVVGLLAVVAVRQSKAARETSARAQVERGVQLLEADDAMGLLYLVEAAKVAPADSAIGVSASRLWAGWHETYAGRLIGMTESVGSWSLAFTSDSSQIVAGSVTGDPVGMWDVATFTRSGVVLDHGAGVYGVATSPDGVLAATAGADHVARLWVLATGEPVGLTYAHDAGVNDVAFSPDGRYLATASDDHTARVWDVATGEAVTPPLQHAWFIYDIEFSPHGSLVATASGDSTVGVWSVGTGLRLYEGLQHDDQAQGVAFSPDGASLATTSDDTTLRVWDVASGVCIAGPAPYEAGLVRVRYSPDGLLLLTGSSASAAQLWDAKTLERVGRPLRHLDPVQGIAFSADGSTAATTSGDGALRLWNVRSTGWPSRHVAHPGRVGVAAYSPGGEIIVTGGSDKAVRLWDSMSASAIGDPLHLDDFPVYLVFSADGDLLVTGTGSTLRFWRGARTEDSELAKRFDEAIWDVAYSPTGKYVAAATLGGVYLWHPTDEDVGVPIADATYTPSVAFSPDGGTLALSTTHSIEFWDVETRTRLEPSIPYGSATFDLAFHPAGTYLAAAAHRTDVRIWDPTTREQVGAPLPHRNRVENVAFSPDGATVLTSSTDQHVRLWDLQTRMALTRAFHLPGDYAVGMAFSADGRSFVTGSRIGGEEDGARVWAIPDARHDIADMERRTWVTLGTRLSARGAPEPIPPAAWNAMKADLAPMASHP